MKSFYQFYKQIKEQSEQPAAPIGQGGGTLPIPSATPKPTVKPPQVVGQQTASAEEAAEKAQLAASQTEREKANAALAARNPNTPESVRIANAKKIAIATTNAEEKNKKAHAAEQQAKDKAFDQLTHAITQLTTSTNTPSTPSTQNVSAQSAQTGTQTAQSRQTAKGTQDALKQIQTTVNALFKPKTNAPASKV